MKTVELRGVGFTPEEIPAFLFEVELQVGRDFDGKFNIRYSLVNHDGDIRLAISGRNEQNILGLIPERETDRVLTELLDKQAHVVCINYKNVEFEPIPGVVEVPMLGRIVGDDFDWVEKTDLPPEYIPILEQMRQQHQKHYSFD